MVDIFALAKKCRRQTMNKKSEWDEGFIAGVKEVINYLEESVKDQDSEGPTQRWVAEAKIKLTNKYL
jgi:hypothetical protein